MVLVIDSSAFYVRRKPESLFGIKYTPKRLAGIFGLWVIGALCVGALAIFSEVVRNSRSAVLVVGCAWPIVFSLLVMNQGEISPGTIEQAALAEDTEDNESSDEIEDGDNQ